MYKNIMDEIFLEMGLVFVEDESMWNKFTKFLHRGLLIMVWSPFILIVYLINLCRKNDN